MQSFQITIVVLLMTMTGNTTSSYMNGDVIIAGLLDIYGSENDKCSTIIPLSVKYHEAIKWTLRKLNVQDYIPGVKLGLQTWPTCGLVTTTNDRAIDLINTIREDKVDTTRQTPPVVGLIGPEHSSEAGNTSLLLSSQRSTDRLVQIGFSTTARSLSNTNLYLNFNRVVPSDDVQIEVMISLLNQLEWNYIVVIYDMDIYGTEGYNALKVRTKEENICITSAFAVPIGQNNAVSSSTIRGFLEKTIELSVSGVIVFSTAPHVRVLLKAAQTISSTNTDQISFIFSEGLELSEEAVRSTTDNTIYKAAKGSYVTAPQNINVDEFEMHWINMFKNVSLLIEEAVTNKWLRDVFSLYGKDNCVPSNDSMNPGCEELEQSAIETLSEHSVYTSYAIQSAYVIANLIKNAHSLQCPGENGLCDDVATLLYKEKGYLSEQIRDLSINFNTDFTFIPKTLSNMTLSFSGNNGVKHDTRYYVYHYRKCLPDNSFCFMELGVYENTTLGLDTSLIRDYHENPDGDLWPNVNHAQCPTGSSCMSCVVNDISDDVFYQDGDVIVCGMVPIHNKDNHDPLKCNGIRTKLGVEIGEALAFAVSLVNQKNGIYKHLFSGKKNGFAIINSCNQPLVVQSKLIELFQKGVQLHDGTYVPIADKLLGCVGGHGSSSSVAFSQILSRFNIIQIAYASTAAILSDRIEHPYFMRTCTPDDKQAKAMIKIIQKLKSNFIQIVYSEGTYGEGGRDAIRREAKLANICIKNEIVVKEGEVYQAIIDKLRVNYFAKIVILFLRSHVVDPVTTIFNDQMQYGEFMFIGSEAWGYKPDQFQTKKKLIGSITLALQMAENDNFTSYLSNFDIFTNTQDPWIKTYAEKKLVCYFSTSFDKTSGSICERNMKLKSSSSDTQEIWIPFALNAMLVLISGTDTAFRELCGISSSVLCDEYRRNPTTVRDKILQQTFDVFGDGSPIRVFDDNGDGNVGYRIYNIQRSKQDASVLIYFQVGQSPLNENDFRFDTNSLVTPDQITLPSICPNTKACLECFPEDETMPNETITITDENKTTITVLGITVGLVSVVLFIILGHVLYTRFRRNSDGEDCPYIDPIEDPYIIPFHRRSEELPYTEPCTNFNTNSGMVDTCT